MNRAEASLLIRLYAAYADDQNPNEIDSRPDDEPILRDAWNLAKDLHPEYADHFAWTSIEPDLTPHTFRSRVIRVTPLDNTGRPTGHAVVQHGFFAITIRQPDTTTTFELQACPTPGSPPIPSSTTPVSIELWNDLPLSPEDDPKWVHTRLCDLAYLTIEETTPDGTRYTGKLATTEWTMAVINPTDVPEATQ